MPEQIKVWRVQDRDGGRGRSGPKHYGVVSRVWGFEDSPDAEVLAHGYNTGKENGGVAVGRHGNYLKCGFSAPPSTMTDAGRAFFLNCVTYIARFDGKPPLVRGGRGDRFNAVRLAMATSYIRDRSFFSRTFSSDLLDQYEGDSAELTRVYTENFEWIYHDGVYAIDEDLKRLGIPSNRTVDALEQMIALLDGDDAETGRRLLERYCADTFDTPAQWRAWFDTSRDRIYFSDFGGYKFRVVPEGYLID